MRKPYSVVKEPEAQKNSVSLQWGEAARFGGKIAYSIQRIADSEEHNYL